MNHQKKIALVTGAGGTIGQAICQRLASDGIEIVGIDISQSALGALQEKLDIRALHIDLNNLEALPSVLSEIDRVDLLINNAGVLSEEKIMNQSISEWNRLFRINLDSALVIMKSYLPGMVERNWGRIINMSSYAAKCGGLTAGTAYSTSKAAMIGLTFSTTSGF